jgi:hypothetical protein
MKQKNTKSTKIKIGVVGEDPGNDSEALCHLLRPLACDDVQFKVVLRNLRGSQLDNERMFLGELDTQFSSGELDYIIFIRDLDGVLSEKSKVQVRDRWFNQANKTIEGKGIFFLAIAEMEALILADIETFNKIYGLKTKPVGNPMSDKDPKKTLMQLTEKTKRGKYAENNAPDIFKSIDFQTVYKNHKGDRSFQTFADELKDKNIIVF